jgi:hypothetical protein
MGRFGHSWYNATKSELIVPGPVILWGAMQHNTVAGGIAKLYDGLDANSGREFADLLAPANQTIRYDFMGIQFERGLYITLDANVENVTLIFDPVERLLTGPEV